MPSAYERHLIAFYLANAAARFHHRDKEAERLAAWVADRDNRAAFGKGSFSSFLDGEKTNLEEEMSVCTWRRLGQALRDECAATKRASRDRTARRLRRLAQTMGLAGTDVAILEFLLRYRMQPFVESMADDVLVRAYRQHRSLNFNILAMSAFLALSANTIRSRFAGDASLVRSGLVSTDDDGDIEVVKRLNRLDTAPAADGRDVTGLLLGAASGSELEWSDFDHLGLARDHIENVIGSALRTGAGGVNVLLYGPPGTGKTEFCKVLAARLGTVLYSVGESDEDGTAPRSRERLQELRLAQRLVARDGRSLLLFDEMEDLLSKLWPGLALFGRSFAPGTRHGDSKVFMHRLLERTPAPTLWTMNDARSVDSALLRRMMFALELRPPTPAVRARIWARQLERHGIEATPEDAAALAREFAATPGVAAGATAAARLAGGGLEAVRRGVQGLSRVLACEAPPQAVPASFDLSLVQADTDPVALAERLARGGERCFSLCLQGPPGTGKSAFVRHLAERLGLEVEQKRASDLKSMWVGETERQIAAAFAEARDTGAFLVFDEADSLLADRRGARAGWEVSQVNEMLTWMESHPLPFACTTNFGDHLDAATLRRFVFKIALDYLSPEQAEAAFRRYFGLAPPAAVTSLAALTPGDFAVVHRKAEILGLSREPAALARMLEAECDAKPDRPRGVGFRLPAREAG